MANPASTAGTGGTDAAGSNGTGDDRAGDDRTGDDRTGDDRAREDQPSPLDVAATRVGDRWSLLLVDALMDDSRRFGELQKAVRGIAPNILSRRLKHLEREGVLVARAYSKRPPRFRYELTAAGRELASALRLLSHWGAQQDAGADAVRHPLCGTPAETRWWCPTCARLLDDDESDDLHHL
jgi:DNA-binding HxlR family transcriptional regulator